MITAVLEILFLLSVSCLIGIFFTYRYWKQKYTETKQQLDDFYELQKESKQEIETLKSALESSKNEQSKANEEVASISAKLQDAEKLVEDEKKNRKNLEEDLKSEKLKFAEQAKELEEATATIKKLKKAPAPKKVATKPKADPEVKVLKEALELKDIELGEMERELEDLSNELHKGKISYYKQIDGKRYKAATLLMADESVAGKGDGRISKEDAEKIFATISDGSAYTQVEKNTMHYIRENYHWTEGADALFRTKVRSWAAKGHHVE